MDFERDLFGIGHQGLEEERRQVVTLRPSTIMFMMSNCEDSKLRE